MAGLQLIGCAPRQTGALRRMVVDCDRGASTGGQSIGAAETGPSGVAARKDRGPGRDQARPAFGASAVSETMVLNA